MIKYMLKNVHFAIVKIGDDLVMKQKFRVLTFVRVCKEMPSYMAHFPSDFDAIVAGSYSQLHGDDDIYSYSLYRLESGKVVDNISWYHETQLTALEIQDREGAEDLIEQYHLHD